LLENDVELLELDVFEPAVIFHFGCYVGKRRLADFDVDREHNSFVAWVTSYPRSNQAKEHPV
jgi:hypothetical protein